MNELIGLIGTIENVQIVMYSLIGLIFIMFTYFLLLGTPVMSYFKLKQIVGESADKEQGGWWSIEVKVALGMIVSTIMVSNILFFIYVDILGIGQNKKEVVENVLIFNGGTGTINTNPPRGYQQSGVYQALR